MADPAQPFRDMVERIEKIAPEEFAGAIVMVPPGAIEPIVFLTTDPTPDLLQFFASVETRVQIRKGEAMDAAQPQQWGRR